MSRARNAILSAVVLLLGRRQRRRPKPEETRLVPESAGLRAISGGFPLVARDDHEILERAGFLYDALYASVKARLGARG